MLWLLFSTQTSFPNLKKYVYLSDDYISIRYTEIINICLDLLSHLKCTNGYGFLTHTIGLQYGS